MAVRTRVTDRIVHPAGYSNLTGWAVLTGPYEASVLTSKCIDVVDGTRDNHPLEINHRSPTLFYVSGRSHNIPGLPDYTWHYNDRPWIGIPYAAPASTPEPSNNASLVHALAQTNPNRPEVDALQFVGEMVDLPKLVRDFGNSWIKKNKKAANQPRFIPGEIGNTVLEFEFWLKPLISDLWKLLDFQSNVEKKLDELRNLQSLGHSSGSAVAWEDTSYTGPGNHYASDLWNESNLISLEWVTTRKKWVSCRWTPSVALPPKGSDAERNLAMRLAHGTDISLAVMWELMPWSWLIDWFSNVGDLVSLSRNTIPVSNAGSCVMSMTTSRIKYHGHVSGSGSLAIIQPAIAPFVSKERTPMDGWIPLPEFNLPFLSGKQLGLLTSLALTRIA